MFRPDAIVQSKIRLGARFNRVHFFDSPDPPAAPDYAGAAQQTAAGNLKNARVATRANRPTQITPFGTLTWTEGPNDRWTSRIRLAGPVNQALQKQLGLTNQYGDIASGLFSDVQGAYAQGFGETDWDQYRADQLEKAYARQMPQFDTERAALENQLVNQGITRGSEAWDKGIGDFDRRVNDYRLAADLQAGSNAEQAMRMASYLQDRPLQVVNALRTGAQPQMPEFGNFSQQAAVPGADLLGAANALYGAQNNAYQGQLGSYNNMLSGLFGLGGAALGGLYR